MMRTPTRVTPIVVRAVTPFASEPVSEDLPWIESFLASTPASPMEAIAEFAESPIAEESDTASAAFADLASVGEFVDEATPNEITVAENVAAEAAAAVAHEPFGAPAGESDSPTEDWPLEDAAADFETLSHHIVAEHGPEAASLFDAAPSSSSSLSPWTDDDFMDIMPVRRSHRTPLSSPSLDSVTWADRARAAQAARDAEDARSAEPASSVGRATETADALELLARRVRAGELAVPEFDSRMGEPAALVAALAAVLGVRLR